MTRLTDRGQLLIHRSERGVAKGFIFTILALSLALSAYAQDDEEMCCSFIQPGGCLSGQFIMRTYDTRNPQVRGGRCIAMPFSDTGLFEIWSYTVSEFWIEKNKRNYDVDFLLPEDIDLDDYDLDFDYNYGPDITGEFCENIIDWFMGTNNFKSYLDPAYSGSGLDVLVRGPRPCNKDEKSVVPIFPWGTIHGGRLRGESDE